MSVRASLVFCLLCSLQTFAWELRYTTYLRPNSITRVENSTLSHRATYCEMFTQQNRFMKHDIIYHAEDAVVTASEIIVAKKDSKSTFVRPDDCMNNPADKAQHELKVVSSIDKSKFGERFEGTAYYVRRWGHSNPYHIYIDTTYPVWLMLTAHRHHHANGRGRCCIFMDDVQDGPANPQFEQLDQAVIPCKRCRVNSNGAIYAKHVVTHFPLEARPMHVTEEKWPQSTGEYDLTPATEYALRRFRRFVFGRLGIPFPETHARMKKELNVVYVKRASSREMSNIDDVERACAKRNCPINFITAESIGSGIDQIKYFSEVDVMIGVEGAAFLHVLHLPLNSVVIQLHPPRDMLQDAILPNGSSINVAKPYRFYTALSLAMGHDQINLCLPGDRVNVEFFFDAVEPYLKNLARPVAPVDIVVPL